MFTQSLHEFGSRPRVASYVFVASALAAACGSIGPTAKAKNDSPEVDLGMNCEPTLVYDCEELCNQGNLGACEEAGAAYFEGKNADKNTDLAWTLSQKACQDGHGRACGTLGKLGQDGDHELDPTKIAEYLDQGCKANDPDACLRQGRVLLLGKGVAKDPDRAHRLFQQACSEDVVEGCYELGVSARTGRAGFQKDLPRAAQLFTQSCNHDIGDACFQIGQMQWFGQGAEQDALRAEQNLEKGCGLDSALACDQLAQLHQAGRGITLDVGKAAKLYEKACRLGYGDACQRLGELLRDGKGIENDPKKAFSLFEKSCTSGDAGGCVAMGKMLHDGPGGFHKDLAAAAKSFQAACDAGNAEGCGLLGVQHLNGDGVPKDEKKARTLLERGCPKDATNLAVCVALARTLGRGIGGKPSPTRAHELASTACAKNDADGCAVLADLTEFGIGTDASAHGAANLYAKACSLGSKNGCLGAAALAVEGIGNAKESVDAVKKLCDEGNARACVILGRAYQNGKGVAQDRDKAYALYKERCEAGTQEACARQGYMHLTGVGAEKSESQGKKLINAACDAGEPTGCFFKTRFRGVSEAEKQKLLRNACDQHQADACKELKK